MDMLIELAVQQYFLHMVKGSVGLKLPPLSGTLVFYSKANRYREF